jgi:hypothetical protein
LTLHQLVQHQLVLALADLARTLATMAINNAAVVACCRHAHRVIAMTVSQAFLSIRRKICLK